jgi:hypothetical protein
MKLRLALGVLLGGLIAAALASWLYGRLMHYEPGDRVTVDFAASPDQARSELGLLVGRGDFYVQRCCPHSVSYLRAGGEKAARFEVRVDDPHVKGNFRAEARLLSNRLGREARYTLVSSTAAGWQGSSQRVIVAQWHGTDDFHLLEPGRYPPLELAIEGDRWMLLKSWDGRLRSPDRGGGNTEGRRVIGQAPFAPGAQARWRFDVRWSDREDGYVRAYKDGVLVADDEGPNAFRDYVGPYMKFGVYVPEWKKKPDRSLGVRQVVVHSASMAQL